MPQYSDDQLDPKHRNEEDVFGFSFHRQLNSAETIAEVLDLQVIDAAGESKTGDFRTGMAPVSIDDHVDAAGAVHSDAQVNVWFKAAGAAEQSVGDYRVFVFVRTSQSRRLVALSSDGLQPRLFVTNGTRRAAR